jgi:hypothetical protein
MLVKMLTTEVLLSLPFLGDDTDKGSFLFVTALVKEAMQMQPMLLTTSNKQWNSRL